MIEQAPQKKSLKAEVVVGDNSLSIQTKDTTIMDITLIALLVFGVVATVYLVKRKK